MGLRAQAAADTAAIIADQTTGFGWPVTITDPDETSADLSALTNDIFETIDPETGVAVAGQNASATFSISSLTEAGLGLPVGVPESDSKPWVVTFDDVNGNPWTFKVRWAKPDRALGVVVCGLEEYTP